MLDDLNEQIAHDPDDDAPQLVMADHLLAAGDPRGELIILEHRDRTKPGGLTDIDALERMLWLAAEYSFPRAHALNEPMLDWRRTVPDEVRYHLDHRGRRFSVRYQAGNVIVNGATDPFGADLPITYDGFEFEFESASTWTERETEDMLLVLSDAVRLRTPLENLRFPTMVSPPPVYEGGSRRIYRVPESFATHYAIARDRFGLAARDRDRFIDRWHRLMVLRAQVQAAPGDA